MPHINNPLHNLAKQPESEPEKKRFLLESILASENKKQKQKQIIFRAFW